ncbi:hypothetical protein Ciccas_010843 [Cichlidogyrus casuarinus]|uniref:Uncharacterized protein n=1 Tax=Cichlidogyrus casuarinus TaxID=1844966 RepID=A0ABD2PSY3_9PLAT
MDDFEELCFDYVCTEGFSVNKYEQLIARLNAMNPENIHSSQENYLNQVGEPLNPDELRKTLVSVVKANANVDRIFQVIDQDVKTITLNALCCFGGNPSTRERVGRKLIFDNVVESLLHFNKIEQWVNHENIKQRLLEWRISYLLLLRFTYSNSWHDNRSLILKVFPAILDRKDEGFLSRRSDELIHTLDLVFNLLRECVIANDEQLTAVLENYQNQIFKLFQAYGEHYDGQDDNVMNEIYGIILFQLNENMANLQLHKNLKVSLWLPN